jgi:hypothetical protein
MSRLLWGLMPGATGRSRQVTVRNILVMRHQYAPVLTGLVEPFFYLLSIGVGVGALVGEVGYEGRSYDYTAFVAPAMLAAAAMNAAISEPFAAIAVLGDHVAIEIEAAIDRRVIRARAVDRMQVPERDVAGLQGQVDDVGRIEAQRAQVPVVQRPIHHPAAHRRQLAQPVAARHDRHGAALLVVAIDGDAGLDVGGRRLPVGFARPAKADVLVVAPLDRARTRRLPVHLVDDLLEILAQERRHDRQHAGIGAVAPEHRIDVGRPLHHAHDPAEIGVVAQPEQHVLVAKAGTVAQRPVVQPIEGLGQLRDLVPVEHAPDDRVAVLVVVREMIALHAWHPCCRDPSLPSRALLKDCAGAQEGLSSGGGRIRRIATLHSTGSTASVARAPVYSPYRSNAAPSGKGPIEAPTTMMVCDVPWMLPR